MFCQCPYCKSITEAERWNIKTASVCNQNNPIPAPLPEFFGDDETPFYCPDCSKKVYGDELTNVEKHIEVRRIN